MKQQVPTTSVHEKNQRHGRAEFRHAAAHSSFDISVFSGMRLFASFIVVYGHVLYFLPIMLSKPINVLVTPAAQSSESFLTALSLLSLGFLNYSVDVFFFMSGYLFGPSFFSSSLSSAGSDDRDPGQRRKTNPTQQQQCCCNVGNIVYHMISRWLRLLPMYVIAWAIGFIRGMPGCRKLPHVLYEALGFINLHPSFRRRRPVLDFTCILVSWSLTTDVQSHILLCVLVLLTRGRPRLIASLVCMLLLVQIVLRSRFVYGLDHALTTPETTFDITGHDPAIAHAFGSALGIPVSPHISPMESANDRLHSTHLTNDSMLYFHPLYRTGPALIGFLTWLCVTYDLTPARWIKRNRSRSMLAAVVGCTTAAACALVMALLKGEPRNIVILWEGFNRVFYATCTGMFVIAMGYTKMNKEDDNKNGQVVKRLFVNKVTSGLAPLSYAVYLVHMFMIWVATEVWPSVGPRSDAYTVRRFATSAVQVYVAACIVAVPCHSLETRCSRWLRRKVLGRGRRGR